MIVFRYKTLCFVCYIEHQKFLVKLADNSPTPPLLTIYQVAMDELLESSKALILLSPCKSSNALLLLSPSNKLSNLNKVECVK